MQSLYLDKKNKNFYLQILLMSASHFSSPCCAILSVILFKWGDVFYLSAILMHIFRHHNKRDVK